jgi:hypothetical protein
VKSQFKSLYRYGHAADCSRKLKDFKVCMAHKGTHPEEKRDAWIARRAERWTLRRLEKSSEDVWEIRSYVCPCMSDGSVPTRHQQGATGELSALGLWASSGRGGRTEVYRR